MKTLFLHRNFPGQFGNIAKELAKDPSNLVMFITDDNRAQIDGIVKLVYAPKTDVKYVSHPYLTNFETAIMHGEAAALMGMAMKERNIIPDVIYGFPWGNAMFMKDIFPNSPLVTYCEWFYNADSADVKFSGIQLTEDDRAHIRCKNSKLLTELCACDAGISPTQWQKSQFPKEFQDKITVIHDGIDTDFFKPNKDAKLVIKDKNIEITAQDEVITYATRGMEPTRGFPEFMDAVAILQKRHPKAHFVIAGDDVICYGQKLASGSYKEIMLKKLNLNMNKVHFVGTLPYEDYLNLLQISSAHIYLTYPYVLSWSFLEAMAAGCCIIASNTEPVLEFMEDNKNGLLVDMRNIQQIVGKVEYALKNQDKVQEIRDNARQTIVDNYALKDLLPKQIDFLKNLALKYKTQIGT